MENGEKEKKTEILKSAAEMFFLHGFDRTKVEDIAHKAKVGKGTVYVYFQSKQQLFEEMVAYIHETQELLIKKIMAKGSSLREKIEDLARYQIDLTYKNYKMLSSVACSKVTAREIGTFYIGQNIRVGQLLKSQIEEAMERRELNADIDSEIASALILGTIIQYCSMKVLLNGGLPEETVYGKISNLIMSGIKNNYFN